MIQLLIAPEGIEIKKKLKTIQLKGLLLIAPEGIEM